MMQPSANPTETLPAEKASEEPAVQATAGLASDTNSRAYTFKELKSITKNFNHSELLDSSGEFGDVFKETPRSGGRLVAVKRVRGNQAHGQASFLAEVNSLGQIRHRNLLQLRGWCDAKQGLFLIYDFMRNSSLDKWLHPNANLDQVTLFEPRSWDARRFILAGVASGLECLHEGRVRCVLHRGIKSSNVMLDENFNPYLGDFGLARLGDHQKLQKTTMPAGTLGYMAPEMYYTGRAMKETNVYAFGVLVLEVVCGRRPFMELQDGDEPGDFLLLDKVWGAHEAGDISRMVDPRLLADQFDMSWSQKNSGDMEGRLAMMANVLQLGLLCGRPNPSERPSMRLVTNWLQAREAGVMELPALPAVQPAPPGRYHVSGMPLSSDGTSSSQWSDDGLKIPYQSV